MKIKNIWLAGGLLLLAACNESEYDLENLVPAEYHKILYVNNSGKQELTLFDTEEDNTYSFSVFKAGSDPYQTASVDVNVLSQEEVDNEYSQLEGVSYKVLSTDCYSLGTTHLDFSVDDRYKLVDIALKPQQVKALMATDPESVWVLPLHVTSESDSINANKDELFLQIMDVIMPALGFTSTSVTVDQYNYGSAPDLNKNIGIGLDTDNKWDITGQLVVDEAYIAEYNEENGTVYQMLPEGTYTVPESVTLAAGITNSSISVAVSASALEPGDYMFTVSYTGYALAVDNVTPGQLYLLMDNNGTLAALDQTAAGLGTPAIRALLGYGTVGVNTIETAVKTPAITYDAASKTIVASSPASAIKSLEVYSASGSKMGNKAGSTNVCRYDASRLAPGVYVVQMNTAGGVVTSKLAIK